MSDPKPQGLLSSLKIKVGAFSVCILLTVAAVYTASSLHSIISIQKQTLEKQKKIMLDAYDEKIQWQVQNIISLIKTYDDIYSKQDFTLDERKDIIKELIRGVRYGTEGYFWIDTFDGVNVLLPPKPATEGTNRLAWTDEDGKLNFSNHIEHRQNKRTDSRSGQRRA